MLGNLIERKIAAMAAQWLRQRCTIEQERLAVDEYGAPTHEWVVLHRNVPCRVITSGEQTATAVQEQGGQESIEQRYKISVPITINLEADMRVTCNGVTYYVVRIVQGLTNEVFRDAVMMVR
jgi:head-tail adaptor